MGERGEDPTSYISAISHLQAPLKTITQLSHIHKAGQSVTLPKTPCRWRKGLQLKDTVWKSKNLENLPTFIDSNENIFPAGGL